ncbi:MAG: aldo/keto reductase [Candidatus Aenigmatarchaeota archaeon]
MKYRKLGRTNLKVSVLGIGGGAFFEKNKGTEQIKEVVRTGFECGINLIETAEDYGEEKIAPAIKGIRDEIILASKSFSSNKKDMERSIRNSLKKMHTTYIEIYMMHTVDSIESLKFRFDHGALDALKEAKQKGIVDWIGITGHRIPVLIEAVKTNEFDVVEVPYCIGAHETEKLFDYTKKYKVGVIAIRPLGGGILIDRNKKVQFMNVRNALRYVISNPNISSALVGVSSAQHMRENIEAIKSDHISPSERRKIEKKVEEFLGKNFCRGCLACMPCKLHGWKFPIDQFLRMEVFYFKYGIKGVESEYKEGLSVSTCKKCGECERNCPYGVNIIKKLERLAKIFGE